MATPGLRIGLLGGSFDPPHMGHEHITRRALRQYNLDQVWWLVSPGNPLKEDAPASVARRLVACRALVRDPRIRVTGLETRLGTRYTADTISRVAGVYPGVRFLWLMGADNLKHFHLWEQWKEIFHRVPIGVLSRPGEQLAAGTSPAARIFAQYRRPAEAARVLVQSDAPAWSLLPGRMVETSSTQLRISGKWIR